MLVQCLSSRFKKKRERENKVQEIYYLGGYYLIAAAPRFTLYKYVIGALEA